MSGDRTDTQRAGEQTGGCDSLQRPEAETPAHEVVRRHLRGRLLPGQRPGLVLPVSSLRPPVARRRPVVLRLLHGGRRPDQHHERPEHHQPQLRGSGGLQPDGAGSVLRRDGGVGRHPERHVHQTSVRPTVLLHHPHPAEGQRHQRLLRETIAACSHPLPAPADVHDGLLPGALRAAVPGGLRVRRLWSQQHHAAQRASCAAMMARGGAKDAVSFSVAKLLYEAEETWIFKTSRVVKEEELLHHESHRGGRSSCCSIKPHHF